MPVEDVSTIMPWVQRVEGPIVVPFAKAGDGKRTSHIYDPPDPRRGRKPVLRSFWMENAD